LTTTDFVSNVVLLSEGKLPSFSSGATKWLRIVAQGNFYLQQFAKERGVDWNWYYDPSLAIGTVSATDSFDIPDTVYRISKKEGDVLRITHTDDTYTDYSFVPHDELKRYSVGNYVAQVGNTIRFNTAFTATSPQFGGSIACPAYEYPETFSGDNDEIDIPDANWLVYVVAADRVKNDVTRKDLRSDLVSQANELMAALKEENMSQIEDTNRPWNPISHVTEDWWTQG
jgi:hypothetical protein